MKEYTVSIREILIRDVKVRAKSEVDAIEKINDMYTNSEIILDYDDFVDMDIKVCDEVGNKLIDWDNSDLE